MRLIARVSLRHSLVVPRLGWASRPLAAPHLRALCTKKDGGESAIAEAKPFERDGVVVKNYGSGLVLPKVTKEQAQNSFLEATDVKRAMTPPVSVAVEARDDMLKDRFNYVSKNLNPAATCTPHERSNPRPVCQRTIRPTPPPPRRRRRRHGAGWQNGGPGCHLGERLRHRRRPRHDGGHHGRGVPPHAVGRHVP